MRVEYLHEGAIDCPLIRIFDFNSDEVRQLLNLFSDLTAGKIHSFAFHDMPFIHCVDDCRLTLYLGTKDEGVIKVDNKSFEWRRTAEGWREVHELAEPFIVEQKGFQRLDEKVASQSFYCRAGYGEKIKENGSICFINLNI